MSKTEWKNPKVNLSSAIIGGAVTLALGLGIGLNWTNIAPYLGLGNSSSASSEKDWSTLNEVYNALISNYDCNFDDNAVF